jgi:hypothetical protein
MNKEGAFKKILPRYINDMNITYLDENQCRKLIYGLKEINRIAYKQIIFKRLEFNQENGKHELLLNTDRNFKQIYGDIKIIYSKIDNNIIIENIEPSRVLMEYHKKRKNTYKGIPFVDQKDIFKINLIREMKK